MCDVRDTGPSLVVSSLRAFFAAIQAAHGLTGIALDLHHLRLVMVMEAIARDKSTRRRGNVTAARPEVLRLLLATRPAPATPLGACDWALLLRSFGAALSCSDLAGLCLGRALRWVSFRDHLLLSRRLRRLPQV